MQSRKKGNRSFCRLDFLW